MPLDDTSGLVEKAIEALHLTMEAGDSDSARVQAAKILLDRLQPKKPDEEQKREAQERDAALAEARGLLADFAATKLALLQLQDEMAEASEAHPDNAPG